MNTKIDEEKQKENLQESGDHHDLAKEKLDDGSNNNDNDNDNNKHTMLTVVLCWCTFTYSWLLISVFPYSGFMAVALIEGLTEETAGSRAGLIASAFMMGRTFSSYGWGKIADYYGRKFALISSLIFSAVFSILFGLSSSFALALLWRFMLGLSNNIIGTAKTIVTEVSYENEKLEAKAMGLVMGMWAWGFLVSPALSGFLAEPVRQYPGAVPEMFDDLLTDFPFLLPNLLSAVFCVAGGLAVYYLVPETLPDSRNPILIPLDTSRLLRDTMNTIISRFSSLLVKRQNQESSALLGHNPTEVQKQPGETERQCYDTLSADETLDGTNNSSPKEATIMSLWSQRDTRNHLLIYWMNTFLSIAQAEAFPLFCIAHGAGLGLSEAAIGKLLSSCGLLFATFQYFVYSRVINNFGLYRSIQIGSILGGPLLVFVPISTYLNAGAVENSLTWKAFLFLSVILAIYRVFLLCFISSISISTNRTVLSSHRGTLNGFSTLGGSLVSTIAPIFAGYLVAFSLSSGYFPPELGGYVIFSVLALIGVAVTVMIFVLLEDKPRETQDEAGSIKPSQEK